MKDFYHNTAPLPYSDTAKTSVQELIEAYEQLKKDYAQIYKEMERYRRERNLAWKQLNAKV